jgi:two-component system, NtrC family, response regulator AtoC
MHKYGQKIPIRIYVLEDNEWYNRLLVHSISLNPDYEVESFASAGDFLSRFRLSPPDIVTLDYKLPDGNGLDILKQIKNTHPETEIIIISEQQDIQTVVEFFKLGVYDYLIKEKDIRSKLLNSIGHITKTRSLEERVLKLTKEVSRKYSADEHGMLIGKSDALNVVRGLITKAASTSINVIITGETGTGKEVVAKSIHYASSRASMPFVAVNVAAIPADLIESELFGHEKGAFTGAASRRIGRFEEANGGTLFLDEIGEMDMAIQAKLLRALQEKEITRLGDNRKIKVDCRILVATHRNLINEVANGRFREDLYYRLYGLPIELPPLRQRGKDIVTLASHFIDLFCKENNLKVKPLTQDAERKLLAHSFPGNVRELKSVVELASVLANSDFITADDIKLSTSDPLTDVLGEEMTLRQYNIRIVKILLKKYNDDVKLVSAKLDIGTATIYRMLKESADSN